MTFRAARADEAADTAAFLRRHLDRAMFPLSNLTHYGMGRQGRYQMRFWLKGQGDAIAAVLGLSAMGMLLPVLPGLAAGDLASLRLLLAGEPAAGLIGPADQAGALRQALGLKDRDVEHMADEPGFALDLSKIILPGDPALTLRRPEAGDVPLLVRWRAAYRGEVMGAPAWQREAAARADIAAYLEQDSHRLLLKDGVPAAMTGFNATLPEAVQVGGVYTPPEYRGRGHARAAVALHLAEARGWGVSRAVLFAANEAAARAYRAIGFKPNGRMSIILFRDGTGIV